MITVMTNFTVRCDRDGCREKESHWLELPAGASQEKVFELWQDEFRGYLDWHLHNGEIFCNMCYYDIQEELNSKNV